MPVSVLIPSYNHAPFVERTLRSVFKQTLPPTKLFVIDDGSNDDSVKIIERILTDCPFDSELIVRENRGLCATLNQGFSLSKDEFFAYISSDDVWLPTFLESRIGLLNQRDKALLAFGHSYLIDENDAIIDCTSDWTNYPDKDILPMLLRGIVPASASVVYRRTTLERRKWNENARLEDYELYLKLSTDGEFALDSNILSAWRQHGWNVSGDFPLMLQEWIEAQNRVCDDLKISRADLDKIQTELRFNATADYIRRGDKIGAFSLMRNNLRGAASNLQIAEMLVRLAVPHKIFSWNRNRKHRQIVNKYGNLNELPE